MQVYEIDNIAPEPRGIVKLRGQEYYVWDQGHIPLERFIARNVAARRYNDPAQDVATKAEALREFVQQCLTLRPNAASTPKPDGAPVDLGLLRNLTGPEFNRLAELLEDLQIDAEPDMRASPEFAELAVAWHLYDKGRLKGDAVIASAARLCAAYRPEGEQSGPPPPAQAAPPAEDVEEADLEETPEPAPVWTPEAIQTDQPLPPAPEPGASP